MALSTKKQSSVLPSEPEKDRGLSSLLHRASIVDTLRPEDDFVPDFQRVTITGEETSGVSQSFVNTSPYNIGLTFGGAVG